MTTQNSQTLSGVSPDAASLRAAHLQKKALREPDYTSWIAAPHELPVMAREDDLEKLGPVSLQWPSGERIQAVCLRMLDAFSIYDWGRMPDSVPGKGAAAAILADALLARMESSTRWVDFSRGVHALLLRKGNRFGSYFNEVGESLQSNGLRTYRLGLGGIQVPGVSPLETLQSGGARLFVRDLEEARPVTTTLFGRSLHSYGQVPQRSTGLPRLLPFEFRFQFQFESSDDPNSTLALLKKDPDYLSRRGFKTTSLEAGRWLDFPVIELFTLHEVKRRPLELEEALALAESAGFSAENLHRSLMLTAWVAGFQRQEFETSQIHLRSGSLRWAVPSDGAPLLASLPGPAEFELECAGIPLALELCEHFYAGTPWAKSVAQARELAGAIQAEAGTVDLQREWKKRVPLSPPALSAEVREWAMHLLPMLVNTLTGRNWFSGAWNLETVCTKARQWLPKDGWDARSS